MSADMLRLASQAARKEWSGEAFGPFRNAARIHLAVADWLDESAEHLEVFEDEDLADELREHTCPTALEGPECSVLGQALTVARAYLGELS